MPQPEEGSEQLAKLIGAFFQGLVKQGVSEELALVLTRDFLETMLEMMKNKFWGES